MRESGSSSPVASTPPVLKMRFLPYMLGSGSVRSFSYIAETTTTALGRAMRHDIWWFSLHCVAPVCGLACSSEAVMGCGPATIPVACFAVCGTVAILMELRTICGLASCRAALRVACGFLVHSMALSRFASFPCAASFRIALCRFLADSFSISFQNAG